MNTRPASSRELAIDQGPQTLILFALGLTAALLALEVANHMQDGMHRAPRSSDLDAFPSSGLRDLVNLAGYALNLVPFAFRSLRSRHGTLRRLLVGLLVLAVSGALYLLLSRTGHPMLATCFQIASAFLASAVVLVEGSGGWRVLPLIGSGLVAATAYASGQHDGVDIATGVVLGMGAYQLSRSRKLGFLDDPAPWMALRREVANAFNLFVANNTSRWDRMYARGEWEFLRSSDQRPRHYVISSIIRDRFPKGAAVLDVGCGHAILYPLLRGRGSSYTGIDVAEAVIRECIREFGRSADCSFEAVALEDVDLADRFDVVVMNEILYYFRPHAVKRAFCRAQSLLRNDDGLVIVSMGSNPKVSRIWHLLAKLAQSEETITTANLRTGSRWTVRVYRGHPAPGDTTAPAGDLRERASFEAEEATASATRQARSPGIAEDAERSKLTIVEWLRYGPFLAQLVVIRRCNLSCAYCFEFDKTSLPVPVAILAQRLARLAELRTWAVCLTGGEPTLHPDLLALVARMREHGFRRRQLITNGYRLTPELIAGLNDAGLTDLQISIDGVNPNAATQKVLALLRPKLELLAELAQFRVVMSTVVGSTPPEEVLEVVDSAIGMGFRPRILLIHDESGQVRLPPEQLEAYHKAKRRIGRRGREARDYREMLIRHGTASFHCRAGARYLYVDEFGQVQWCSQTRGTLSRDLLTYGYTDLRAQFDTSKACNTRCTIGCARTASAFDEQRPQGVGSGDHAR